jgi:hypothetical protein
MLCIWLYGRQKYTVMVATDVFPGTVIGEVVTKKTKGMKIAPEKLEGVIRDHQEQCILKMCGSEEYLFLDNHPISQYKVNTSTVAVAAIPSSTWLSIFSS